MTQNWETEKFIWKEKAEALNLKLIAKNQTFFMEGSKFRNSFFFSIYHPAIGYSELGIRWFESEKKMIDFLKFKLPVFYFSQFTEHEFENVEEFLLRDICFFFENSIDAFEKSVLNYQRQIDKEGIKIDPIRLTNLINNNFKCPTSFAFVKWSINYIGSNANLNKCADFEIRKFSDLFFKKDSVFVLNPHFFCDLPKFFSLQSLIISIKLIIKGMISHVLELLEKHDKDENKKEMLLKGFSIHLRLVQNDIDKVLSLLDISNNFLFKKNALQIIEINKLELDSAIVQFEASFN